MDTIKDEELIPNVLKHCFPQAECIKITKSLQKEDGEHFTSNIIHVDMEYMQDEQIECKHLVLKIPTKDRIYQFFDQLDAYNKEVHFYNDILPRMNEYLHGSLFPIHYHTTDSRIQILEDMSAKDYKNLNRREFFGLEESCFILRCLARFHATSYKIYQKNKNLINEKIFQEYNLWMMKDMIVIHNPSLIKQIMSNNNVAHLIPKFNEFSCKLLSLSNSEMNSAIHHNCFSFSVLNHGDYRLHNILFHRVNGQIDDIKLVDYQACWWSSPVFDFIYFIITSVSIDAAQNHIDELIDSYLNELNEMLENLKCFSRYDRINLMADLQKIKSFSVFILMFSFHMWVPKKLGNIDAEVMENKKRGFTDDLNDEILSTAITNRVKLLEKWGVFDD